MTITFPRAMPPAGAAQQVFEPQEIGYETAEAGGDSYGVAAGFPRWRAEWTLGGSISALQSDEWRAFIASLKGSQRTFLGRDYERTFPRLYKAGFTGLTRAAGGAFDGSLTSWSQSIGADGQSLVTLSGLPAGFQLSQGDYADFRWTTGGVDRRALIRTLENATADGSGVITGVSCEPAIPSVVPGGAVAHLDSPACVMRLVSGQTSISAMDRRRAVGAKVVAMQDIRA